MIQLNNITKVYTMGSEKVQALKGITFGMKQGDFTAVMGSSGSGKSTLMNIAGCLDRPTSGQYLFEGTDVSRLDDRKLAAIRQAKIGFVFQSFNLLPRLTALGNVELPMVYAGTPAKERRERALSALKRVGLAERASHRPTELSGGQAQRVAIARSLVNQPSLILADEPTGALDTKTGEEVMSIFTELNEAQGIGVLLVTHEPEIARYAKHVVWFRDGSIVDEGTPAQVLKVG